MPNTPVSNTLKQFQAKAPLEPCGDKDTRYVKIAEQDNSHTQSLINAHKLAGVEVIETATPSRQHPQHFHTKLLQHHASFANSYEVDASSTANDIIITPSNNNIQTQLMKLEDTGTAQVPGFSTSTQQVLQENFDDLLDAQMFDAIPNGALFCFTPTLSNTSSAVDITVRVKRPIWDTINSKQTTEIKNFTYPTKHNDGITSLVGGDIVPNKTNIFRYNKILGVFMLAENARDKPFTKTYNTTFATNTYTLQNGVYTAPLNLFDGFHTSFVAPNANTDSASVSIQLYDGTFETKVLKKYSSGTLVNLVANDIRQSQLYTIVIIGGELVVFGVSAIQLSDWTFTDLGGGNFWVKHPNGMIMQFGQVVSGNVLANGSAFINYHTPFTSTVGIPVVMVQNASPDNGIIAPQTLIPGDGTAFTRFQLINKDADSALVTFRWTVTGF